LDKPITARRICPYCKQIIEIGGNVVICTACGTAHHFKCWDDSTHCATIGCAGTPRNEEYVDILNPIDVSVGTTLPAVYAHPFEFPIPTTVMLITIMLISYGLYGLAIVIKDFHSVNEIVNSEFVRNASLNEYFCRMAAIVPMMIIGWFLLELKQWARIWAMRTLFIFYFWMLANDIVYLLNRQDFIDNKVSQRWIDNVATSQTAQVVWVIVFLLIAMIIKCLITFTAIYHLASMQLINEFDNAAKHKVWMAEHKENDETPRNNIDNTDTDTDTETKKSESSITYVGFDD